MSEKPVLVIEIDSIWDAETQTLAEHTVESFEKYCKDFSVCVHDPEALFKNRQTFRRKMCDQGWDFDGKSKGEFKLINEIPKVPHLTMDQIDQGDKNQELVSDDNSSDQVVKSAEVVLDASTSTATEPQQSPERLRDDPAARFQQAKARSEAARKAKD